MLGQVEFEDLHFPFQVVCAGSKTNGFFLEYRLSEIKESLGNVTIVQSNKGSDAHTKREHTLLKVMTFSCGRNSTAVSWDATEFRTVIETSVRGLSRFFSFAHHSIIFSCASRLRHVRRSSGVYSGVTIYGLASSISVFCCACRLLAINAYLLHSFSKTFLTYSGDQGAAHSSGCSI